MLKFVRSVLASLNQKGLIDSQDVSEMEEVPSKVIYMHIPKCGGTSIAWNLSQKLPLGEISLNGSEYVDDPKRYRFVRGHWDVDYVLGPAFEGYQSVTLLRDPIERLVSSCNFVRSYPPNDPQYDDPRIETLRNSSVTDLPNIMKTDIHVDNLMVRMVAGDHIWMPGRKQHTPPVTEETVQSALDNLSKFSVVGFTEEMMPFYERILEILSLENEQNFENRNVTKANRKEWRTEEVELWSREELPDEVYHLLRFDQAFYDEARRRYMAT